MASSIRQAAAFTDAAGAGASIGLAFASPVLAGSVLVAFVTNDTGTADPTSITVADTVNGAWPAALQNIRDATNQDRITAFVFRGTTGSASGTPTVTVTFATPTNPTFRGICILELTGVDPTVAAQSAGQGQLTPTTGANAVTSGNTATLTQQPNIVIGFSMDTAGTGTPATGTGYASSGTGFGFGGTALARVESKNTSATTAVAATFTAAANEGHVTVVIVLFDSATVAAVPFTRHPATDVTPFDVPDPVRRASQVAAILAPAPAPPDTVLRPARRLELPTEDAFTPRARSMIAAVLAVASTVSVPQGPRPQREIEPEQTFLRPRLMAALLPPSMWVPEVQSRQQLFAVEPEELPVRRRSWAATIPGPDTVLCPPIAGAMYEDPEWLPRPRPGIAALIAAPAAPDVVLRPLPRLLLPADDDVSARRRPQIVAVIYPPDFVPRPPRRIDLPSEDEPPLRQRPDIAAILPPPDFVPRVARHFDLPPAEEEPARARPDIAAILAPAPAPDSVLRAPPRLVLPLEDDVAPLRRPKIAAAIAGPDTVLRPTARVTAVADEDAPAQRRLVIAAILMVGGAADVVLRPGRRVDLAPDEATSARARPGVAALLAPAPVADFVSLPARARAAGQDDDALPARRPGIAAVIATPPPAPDYVSRAPRRQGELEPEQPAQRPRPGIAAVLPAPALDTVLRPSRGLATWSEDEPLARARPKVAALLAGPDFVVRGQQRLTTDAEELAAPPRRPGIAAVLPPLAAFMPRSIPRLPPEEPPHVPLPSRPRVAAVLATPPAPPDTVLAPPRRQCLQALWESEAALQRAPAAYRRSVAPLFPSDPVLDVDSGALATSVTGENMVTTVTET
jgi:hypothetical protein